MSDKRDDEAERYASSVISEVNQKERIINAVKRASIKQDLLKIKEYLLRTGLLGGNNYETRYDNQGTKGARI